jgi:mono/diheme cytochrome c family protein
LWIGGYCALPLAAILLALLFLSGCSAVQRTPPIEVWDDMKRQGKYMPQMESAIFEDSRGSRRPPENTIARGHLTENTAFYTGMEGEVYVGKNPVPITAELLQQGQTKFNIYCTPCHDREGYGKGIVPLHVPTWQPSNLMEDRVVQFVDGDIFNVITNGRRTMPAYRFQIDVADRWAIVAYVRVLQRAHHSTISEVPAEMRTQLQ